MDVVGHVLGGLVAGEGCFRSTERQERFRDGTPRVRFVFELSMALVDASLVHALHSFLGGAGTVRTRSPRRPGWQPEVCLTVASERLHRSVTIPFADRYLAPCHKRAQFDRWRRELEAYRARRIALLGEGRSRCVISGCERWVRGRGLCRSHYYEATGW